MEMFGGRRPKTQEEIAVECIVGLIESETLALKIAAQAKEKGDDALFEKAMAVAKNARDGINEVVR